MTIIKRKTEKLSNGRVNLALRVTATAAVILQSSLSLLLPTFANASSQLGNGTPTSPYQITSCSQLAAIDTKPASNYQLQNDLSCTTGWSSVTLSGSLDGQNHTISGLTSALFASLTGTVKDLALTNLNVTGQGQVGSVADQANGATVTSVTANGNISVRASSAG